MADQFQIPQRNPPAIPFNPPTSLIEAYLNRPTGAEVASKGLGNAIGSVAQYKQYQLQKQLAASEALGKMFGQGGPYAVQQYGGPLQRMLGIGNQPTAQTQPPVNSGVATPPQPNTQPTPVEQAAQMSMPSQHPNDPYGTIQASVNAGNHDHLGYYPQTQTPSSTPVPSPQPQGTPDFAGALKTQQAVQTQMDQANQMYGSSVYGLGQQKVLQDKMAANKTGLDIAQAPLKYAGEQQSLANAKELIPQQNKAKIESIQKEANIKAEPVRQAVAVIDNLYGLYKKLPPDAKGLWGGTLQETVGNLTKGKYGAQAKALQELGTAYAGQLNKAEGINRTGVYELGNLINSLARASKDPKLASTEYNNFRQGLLGNIKNFQQSAQDQVDAYVGGKLQPLDKGIPPPAEGPHGDSVTQNGHTYSWNQATGKYE